MARAIRQCAHPLCENDETLGGSGYCSGHFYEKDHADDKTCDFCAVVIKRKGMHISNANGVFCSVKCAQDFETNRLPKDECAAKNCHAPRALDSRLCLAHGRFVNTWDGSVGRGVCGAENCNASREEDSVFCPAHRYFFSQPGSVSEKIEERRCAYCDLDLGNTGIDVDDECYCNNGCLYQARQIEEEKGLGRSLSFSEIASVEADSLEIRPNYYRAILPDNTEVECFELIDALGLDFYLGNALKYLWRAGKKEGASKVEDLCKIRTYVEQALERAREA